MLRPLLAFRPLERLRVLANPLVALPIWAANLYLWHVPFLYRSRGRPRPCTRSSICFFSAGIIAWLPVRSRRCRRPNSSGPTRSSPTSRSSGSWRHCSGTSSSGRAPSSDVYDRGEELWGVSPLRDQGLAGAVMMIEGSLVTIVALAWLFLRLAQEGELRRAARTRPRPARRPARRSLRARAGARRAPLKTEARCARAGVHHVDLVVCSIERSLPFYRELLGPLGYARREVEGERGETIWYLGGAGCAVGLREAQSEGGSDRYRIGLHHVAFSASSRGLVDERHDEAGSSRWGRR